jgi:hypothetical protein
MSLVLEYYGQNVGNTVPNVTLTGNPGVDQQTLTNAGYLGGKVMAIVGKDITGAPRIAPCDAYTMQPFGLLANGPGEFSGAIGPSGSKKAPVFRAMLKGSVDSQAYTGSGFVAGKPVFCGTGTNAGFIVSSDVVAPVAVANPTPVAPVNGVSAATATFTFHASGDTIFGEVTASYASGAATTTTIPEGTTLAGAVTLLTAGLPSGITASTTGATIVLTGAGNATADTISVTGSALNDVYASGGVVIPAIGICTAAPSQQNAFTLHFASLL